MKAYKSYFLLELVSYALFTVINSFRAIIHRFLIFLKTIFNFVLPIIRYKMVNKGTELHVSFCLYTLYLHAKGHLDMLINKGSI